MDNYRLELGTAENIEHEPPYIYDIKDRFEHFYILGKSGAGKSVVMERMAKTDIDYGCAVIYIDPKGTSTRKLYNLIEDKSRVIYISVDHPILINPLNKKGYTTDNIIAEFVQILDVLVTLTSSNPESSVLMKEIVSNAIYALKEEDRNIKFLSRFLMYEDVRMNYRHNMSKDILEYWIEFDAFEKGKSAVRKNRGHFDSAKRVASRLNAVIGNDKFNDFFVGENNFDISDVTEQRKVVLVDTSKFTREKRIYLSNLIVYAITSYCQFGRKADNPLMCYVDEFQTCVSPLFSDLLGLAREYKVGFTLAHHNFEEITQKVLSSVLGNVRSFLAFNCGDDETKKMASVFNLKQTDFSELPDYMAWARIGNKKTLLMTDPPLKAEKDDLPVNAPVNSPVNTPNPTISYLRHGWIEV